MKVRLSWKVWVVILSIISILLLLLVVKLVYDKATRDTLKAQVEELVKGLENQLDLEFERINTENWEFVNQNSTASVTALEKSNHIGYEALLRSVKVNMSGLPWGAFNSSILSRKLQVAQHFPVFLLSKNRLKSIKEVKENITRIQVRIKEEAEMVREKSGTVPKQVTRCQRKVLSAKDWTNYYNAAGEQTKPLFSTFIKLMNEEAILNKSPHAGAYWLSSEYEMDAIKFQGIVVKLWEQIRPFYVEFHAYLRGELNFSFEGGKIPRDGEIPAQFLDLISIDERGGCSMISEATRPYPGIPSMNLTDQLQRRRYSPVSIAKFAEDFISSLGLPTMTPSFWADSKFGTQRPRPRLDLDSGCDPKIFEFPSTKEFRVSICGVASEEILETVNGLLVRITLKGLSSQQSFLFRQPLTPAINGAAEEALAIAMSSQSYLRRMGLLDDYSEGLPATLNILYQEAFKLLPKLTLSLVFNQWFQDTYSNRVKPVNYNCHWWKLRSSLEGIKPPEFREASDFDPASHFNLISTPADNLKVFVESVLKYQVYTVLCGLSAHESIEVEGSSILPSLNINQTSRRGETSNKDAVSLRDCNLAGNSAVGERLSQLLSPGSSKSWQELLTHFGIRGGLDASAMLEYFKPLHAYLKEVNSRRELHVGWRQTLNDSCK